MAVLPAKTQISLGIRPVRSESSLCARWVAKGPSFHHADSEDSDQSGLMPRLIWVFAGCTVILLVFYVTAHIQCSPWAGCSFLIWVCTVSSYLYVSKLSFTVGLCFISKPTNTHTLFMKTIALAVLTLVCFKFEPPHDKTNKMTVRPAKTQINLGIRPVWSESLLCAQWVTKDPSFLMRTTKSLIRQGGCPGWSESSLGAHAILSWGGSFVDNIIFCSLCKKHFKGTRGGNSKVCIKASDCQ